MWNSQRWRPHTRISPEVVNIYTTRFCAQTLMSHAVLRGAKVNHVALDLRRPPFLSPPLAFDAVLLGGV